MVEVRVATPQDRALLATTLASAFAEDPFFRWIAGPGLPLEPRMRIVFDTLLRQYLRRSDHMVFVTEDGTGGAIWHPVGRWKMSTGEVVRTLPGMFRSFRARTPRMIAAFTAIEKDHPTEPHYYLEVLGTRQDQQSKGIGSSLITSVLDRCDQEGLPAYLESANPQNFAFYARHGFEISGEIDCGKGAPVVKTMRREPRY